MQAISHAKVRKVRNFDGSLVAAGLWPFATGSQKPYRPPKILRDAWSVRIRVLATYSGQSAVSSVAPSERGVYTGDKCPTEYVAAYKATLAAAPFQGAALSQNFGLAL